MSVATGQAKLKQAARDLAARWAETRAVWRDENARLFEERFIEPLLKQTRETEETFGYIETVLHRLREECR